MPSIHLVVEGVHPDDLAEIAERAGKKIGLQVDDPVDSDARVRRGSLVASIFVGAFILYLDLKIYIEDTKKKGIYNVDLEWVTPWWTGIIGIARTNRKAKEFAEEFEYRIEKANGEILKRRG